MKSFTRALSNTDHEVSVPKCPGKWLYFINQRNMFQINYINMDLLLVTRLKFGLLSTQTVQLVRISFRYINYLPLLARDHDGGCPPCNLEMDLKGREKSETLKINGCYSLKK